MFILLASSLSLIYNDFNFERIPHRRPFTVCSRYIRTRRLIGFGGIRTHDILTPFKDWLRARRSAWLSYEPSGTIHQLEIFKSKHLYGTDLTSLYLSDEGLRLIFIVWVHRRTDKN